MYDYLILYQFHSNTLQAWGITNVSKESTGLQLLPDYNVLQLTLFSKLLFDGRDFADFVTDSLLHV
jgi:hypothetical protein